jgi:hypothetical protein
LIETQRQAGISKGSNTAEAKTCCENQQVLGAVTLPRDQG